MAARPFLLIADDFGMSPGVNEAILELAARGRLSGTGLMVTLPDAVPAVRRFLALGPPADLGLHLDLTAGTPLTPIRCLARDGRFPGDLAVIARAFTGRLARAELRAEIAAQVRRFAKLTGGLPAFIDGHQHMHSLPVIRHALIEAIGEVRPGWRPFLRDPAPALAPAFARRVERLSALAVFCYSRGFTRAIAGFPRNDSFSGKSHFGPDTRFATIFARYLAGAGRCHMVMCHPGHADAVLAAVDPLVAGREPEYRFLMSDAFPQVLAGAGFRVGRLAAFG